MSSPAAPVFPPPPPMAGAGGPLYSNAIPWATPRPPAPPPWNWTLTKIRDAVGLYRWALLLAVIANVASAVLIVAGGSSVGRSTGLSLGALPLGASAPGGSAAAVAVAVIGGLLGLIGLILSILAFVGWRSAVKSLPAATPWSAGPGSEAAQAASRGYRYSLYVMLTWILALIAGVVILTVAIFSAVLGSLPAGNNTTAPSPAAVNNVVGQTLGIVAGVTVVLLLLQLLLAHYVLTSLEGFATLTARGRSATDASQNRLLVYVGVLLGGVGVVSLVAGPYVLPLGVIGTLLLLLVAQRYHRSTGTQIAQLGRSPTVG